MAKKKTFEDNINRLDEILTNLENTDVSMTDTIKFYKEGLDLVINCSKELNEFEQKVTELKHIAEESLKG